VPHRAHVLPVRHLRSFVVVLIYKRGNIVIFNRVHSSLAELLQQYTNEGILLHGINTLYSEVGGEGMVLLQGCTHTFSVIFITLLTYSNSPT
jgi:hypothetical protein